jgi:RNA polymerase sigma-70 factor (ECF subfamily)
VRLETARAYLVAVARNVYLENLRKRKREAPLDFAAPAPDNTAVEYEWREELGRLQRLMAGLPETTRSALIMHAVLGMSYAEMEAVLGLPVAALKVRVHRARIQLAAQMTGEEVSR